MSQSPPSSSRSSLAVSSSGGLYIPAHKRSISSASSVSSSESSPRSPCSFSFTGNTSSSDSESVISPPATPAFIYSRDILLNLANSPLSRMSQSQRDDLRSEVPEVMTNRKQRRAIEHFNHLNTVQSAAVLPTYSIRSVSYRPKRNRTSKPVIV